MKLSAAKFVLLLVLIVCFVTTKVLAKHHDKHDHDCDHDDDDDNDWEDEDWNDEDWDDKDWDNDENKDWDHHSDGNWNGDNEWNRDHNGQGWSTGYQPSGSIVAGGSTIWSGSGWPMPTNSYGQPPYPTHATPGVVTATWTQVIPTGNPTNVRNEPQIGSTASNVKSMGIPVLLAAVAFSMFIAA